MARQHVRSLLKSFAFLRPSPSPPPSSSPLPSLPCSMLLCRAMSRLFVGGLSFTTEEDGLRSAFAKFGEVIDAKVVKDRETGRSRGFGFVTFMEEEQAEEALNKMSGQFLDGRVVRVDRAAARPPRPPSPSPSPSPFPASAMSSFEEQTATGPEDWGTIPSTTMAPIPQNLGLYAPPSASDLPDLSSLAASASASSASSASVASSASSASSSFQGLPNLGASNGSLPPDSSSSPPSTIGASGGASIPASTISSSSSIFDTPTKASTKDTGPSFGFIDLDLSNLPPPDPNHVPRRRPPRIRPSSMGDYEFGYYMSETSKFPFNTNFDTGIPRSSGPLFDFEFEDIKQANAAKKAEWLAIKQAQEAEEAAKQAEEAAKQAELQALKKAKEEEEEAALKLAKEAEEQANKAAAAAAAAGGGNEDAAANAEEHRSVLSSDVKTSSEEEKEKSEAGADVKPQESTLASQNTPTEESSDGMKSEA